MISRFSGPLLLAFFSVLSIAIAFSPSSRLRPSRRRSCHVIKMSTEQDDATLMMEQAKLLISKAISIGAPAYNSGDIQGCARVYKDAALEIVPLLPIDMLRNALEKTVQTSYDDDKSEAWALRREFDTISDYQVPFMPNSNIACTLEKFTPQQLPEQPLIVNDNVMGGVSQGQWLAQTNTFFGTTSLQNNGGFASLRWRFERIQNWSYATGIYLKVRHSKSEQHTFRLVMKDTTCEQARGANYKNVFSNPNGEEGPILIPFTAFDQMEQMGRQLTGPSLNPLAITEIGVMAIKPTVVGEFELAIEEWGVYV